MSRPRVAYAIIDWRTPRLAEEARASIVGRRREDEVRVLDAEALGLSYGGAVNRAEREADPAAEVFVCSNADVRLLSLDDALLDLFEDPRLAVVGPRQVDAEGRLVHAGIISETGRDDGFELDLHHRYWRQRTPNGGVEPRLDVPTISGSVMYWRREAFREVGGLGTYPLYYEDTIACYRARARGWAVAYSALALWLHRHEGSPLSREERVGLLGISRELFVEDCRAEGIELTDLPLEPA